MFWHNFKYSLNTLFKNKTLIFWTFAFPLILGTFFDMAFSDIAKNEKLEVFDIAVVEKDENEENKIYTTSIDELSIEGDENQLFNTHYTSLEDAKNLLEKGEITGYVVLDDTPKVVVKSSGIEETILKSVIEEIATSSETIKIFIEENVKNADFPIRDYETFIEKLVEEAKDLLIDTESPIEDISRQNLDYTMIEFYTLIAMSCLYSGILALYSIDNVLANMSNKGKRVAVSPTRKGILVLSSTLASYVVQVIGLSLLFAYSIFILDVDFGNNLAGIILLSLVGSFAGLSIGLAVATVVKSNENMKTGIIISLTMLGCFLSGMMGISMKYIIDKNVPLINRINPANMITDGFYSLYYYDTPNRFYLNIFSLIAFSLVLIGASIFVLRRQKYDSI